MTIPRQTGPARWADLKVRVASAAVLIALGLVEIHVGGGYFRVGLIALTAVMIWELAGLTAPNSGPVPPKVAVP